MPAHPSHQEIQLLEADPSVGPPARAFPPAARAHSSKRWAFPRPPRHPGFCCVRRALIQALCALALPAALQAAQPAAEPGADARRCLDRDPERRAFFGALHVHTAFSFDSSSWDVRNTPDDAYRFARGEELRLPPLDAAGAGTRGIRLPTPLDFAAVTDHSELLGEVRVCQTPGMRGYASAACRQFRGELLPEPNPFPNPLFARLYAFGIPLLTATQPQHDPGVCPGPKGGDCPRAAASAWSDIQAAAARWNDATDACRFTTFVAYEYSALPESTNLHRNVIFRSAQVPARPISYADEPEVGKMWRRLREACPGAAGGCDVLAIPHNSNWSNGRIFAAEYPEGASLEEQHSLAALRAALEPVAEIFQHKGDSECRSGFANVTGDPDPLCDFEKLLPGPQPADDCGELTGKGGAGGGGCESRLSYVRYGLLQGLREAERLGVNPLQLGIIADTDTHNGAAGYVDEVAFQGHMGLGDAAPASRLALSNVRWNPGGLAGVYSDENSRESLFDAIRRRETFGTSGPRITPRFFGGWAYPADLCQRPDFVHEGYASGVPMGGTLPRQPDGALAPMFAVSALRDTGNAEAPGGQLQRIQIVKGTLGADGSFVQRIFAVAGSAQSGASVDLATCAPAARGSDSLCQVWRDPDFDPDQRAVYYARVLENPSCRWHWRECSRLPEAERPAACADPDLPRVIQERAWTSPIWYVPPQPPPAPES